MKPLAFIMAALLAAGALAQDVKWADSEYNLGKDLYKQGKYYEAEPHLNNAIRVYKEKGDKKYELYASEQLAQVLNKTGRYDQAITLNFQLLAMASSLNDLSGVGLANNRLGVNYYNKGDYSTAAIYYQAALAQSRQSNKTEDIKIDLKNLVDVYNKLGKYDEANKYQSEIDQLNNSGGYKGYGTQTGYDNNPNQMSVQDADNLKKAGEDKMTAGNYNEALQDLQTALQVYQVHNDESFQKLTQEKISRCHYYLGRYQEAMTSAYQALSLAQKTNDSYGQGVDYNTIGMSQYYMGQQQEAMNNFMTAYSFNSMEGSSKTELKTTAYFLSMIYKNMGNYNAATQYEQQYNSLQSQGY